jgi:hypothetical protein
MSTVSLQLVLGLCILGACIATVVGYSLSCLLRKKVLNEHEESGEMTNPFHEMSREQKEYMAEVRSRTTDALWERLRIELQKDKEGQSAMIGIKDGSRGRSFLVSGPRASASSARAAVIMSSWLTITIVLIGRFAIRLHGRAVRRIVSFRLRLGFWFPPCGSVWRQLCEFWRLP